MPRKARKNIVSNYIHLMIQGINKEYIFNNEMDIKIYLKYLKEKIQNTDVKIIAYCMMNNHAHFLVHYSNIKDVSKLMSQVDTKYARYYNKENNRCGFVFRNRFKSEEIINYSHLTNCIKYIHNNPVKAGICKTASDYKYSSYNEYKQNRWILIDINYIRNNLNSFDLDMLMQYDSDDLFIFIEDDEIQAKENFKRNIMEKYLKEHNLNNVDEIKDSKKHLKQIIFDMYFKYNLSKKDISDVLGINRFKIYKIINELEGVSQNVQK